MNDQMDKARKLKEEILNMIKSNPKTSWGKNELIEYLKDVYTNFIERYVE